jgi:hypothetical protein
MINSVSKNNALVILYIFALLDTYDKAIDKSTIEIDPYREKIHMRTDGGDYIQVPDELHKYAIEQWIEKKGKLGKNTMMDENNDLVNDIIQLVLCIFVIFVLIYCLSLMRKGLVKFG